MPTARQQFEAPSKAYRRHDRSHFLRPVCFKHTRGRRGQASSTDCSACLGAGKPARAIGCISSSRCNEPPRRFGARSETCKIRTGSAHAARPAQSGGARRDRTDDLVLAKHALSQLSYGPIGERRTEDRQQRTDNLSSVFCCLSSEAGGPGKT